ATQNPLEQAGTFPLPESQMDRFLMRISLGYPDREAEKRILKGEGSAGIMAELACCMKKDQVAHIQDEVEQVHTSDHFLSYLQNILEFTRTSGKFQIGLSPRAGLSLLRAAKAWAYIRGRDHTIPEDLQEILPWVAGHRLRLSHDLEYMPGEGLMELFKQVRIPV
ncbi:MAG: MoxR family ATPase, partial [Desulfobacterales bacterium]|nr:MoxR family ATPase [Desulfobacterales bacterium]